MKPVTPRESAEFGARVRSTMKIAGTGILGGVISNLVGPIPDAEWQALMADASNPCGVSGCDCHVVRPKVMAGLDEARADWRRIQAQLS